MSSTRHGRKGEGSAGVTDGGSEVFVAYAEFSTSRLMTKNSPRLIVRRASDKERGDKYSSEQLPVVAKKASFMRRWTLRSFSTAKANGPCFFFLDEDGAWIKTYIKINDWTVRLNDSEM